ncbi:MAG: peptidoglycan DD-metalloendopeptidase family protein [Rikenellaceae bacterium]|nr:peptidoglycan DD-metalloendopeptidase family protein [Rikenellaceae bacterium]
MQKLTLILLAVALLAAGCTKKSQSVSVQSAPPHQVVVSEGPAFVTPCKENFTVAPVEMPEEISRSRQEVIAPITFASKETEHVRIVDYNPFGNHSELEIDLDALAEFFVYPYPGNKISDYGMRGRSMHTGVDIKTPPNDTVRAVLGGVVRMSKLYSSYGNIVVIRHLSGLETVYSHNSKNLVQPNQVVQAGQPIALSGRTGRATTEHIHFETRVMGEHFDPNLFLDTQNRTIQRGKIRLVRQNGRILASNSMARSSAASQTSQPSLASSSSSAGSGATASRPASGVYTVQRGDTLYSISRQYGLTVEQLCALNGISANGILSIGQKLKLN